MKIQPNSAEKYLPIVEKLKNKQTEFYTYQLKEEKNFKVVLRNMHPSVDPTELKNEIESYNHQVTRIANIKHNVSKISLPLFFIELKVKENNKKIYEINKLLYTIVSFEPPHKKRDIPQCLKYQGFGHTKNYCYKNPVCVKCAENYLTSACPINTKVQNVICANCIGNDPASYKGCIVRKQLQQKLFPALREKRLDASQQLNKTENFVRSNVSYAQAASNSN